MRPDVDDAIEILTRVLMKRRSSEGYWTGHLSSSALSTATALSALSVCPLEEDAEYRDSGAKWLEEHRNADGGWGDTPDSPSNLSATLLSASALRLYRQDSSSVSAGWPNAPHYEWISRNACECPSDISSAVKTIYGDDSTFAVPILMNCALAGLVPWKSVQSLPFELAAAPSGWYRALRLNVVSYALPALIAIGVLVEAKNPTSNPIAGALRKLTEKKALEKLASIQPDHGGFLDATPLTAFVAMSLIARYGINYPAALNCLHFLRRSMRSDGSWPIDTDLSVWLTSAAVKGLVQTGQFDIQRDSRTLQWLKLRQFHHVHPYTDASPGGWGWTHHAGSVPDADDTSGALIALKLAEKDCSNSEGVTWLLDLQNADGGWPTFCRGWGQLPFDRSSPDITAHCLRALHVFSSDVSSQRALAAIKRALNWLQKTQSAEGYWVPLWFGNQLADRQENPVYGTSQVLIALGELNALPNERRTALEWLLSVQGEHGGWGGDKNAPASMEETSLAVSALSACGCIGEPLKRGVDNLIKAIQTRDYQHPTPIGLYFSSLWYSEELYPVLWPLEALGRVKNILDQI
jgi:squalene-hopene/tetraprenyl-beta-curcumene cyclase